MPTPARRQLARFQREAEAVARLLHPNMVQIYEVGTHDGRLFFSLEYVEGGSLAQRLDGTPLPARQAVELMATLARASDYAHQQGIVHRDLTPNNVLLTAAGIPKITDFGLAKFLIGGGGSPTRTGSILGTPSYMAPEQAQANKQAIGPATDVYALGAILYEMLTGRPPVQGGNAAGHGLAGRQSRAGAAEPAAGQSAARPGDHLPEMPA